MKRAGKADKGAAESGKKSGEGQHKKGIPKKKGELSVVRRNAGAP